MAQKVFLLNFKATLQQFIDSLSAFVEVDGARFCLKSIHGSRDSSKKTIVGCLGIEKISEIAWSYDVASAIHWEPKLAVIMAMPFIAFICLIPD